MIFIVPDGGKYYDISLAYHILLTTSHSIMWTFLLYHFSNLYEPGHEEYNEQGWTPVTGWTLIAHCEADSSMSPTASPNFSSLSLFEGGCPPTYDESSALGYEADDIVSIESIVFKCKPWPYGAYCKLASDFSPNMK
jgi:hypothetical protein